MHDMFHKCHLVHGDLSGYNLLYHERQVYVIDVGQAVDESHPRGAELLHADCGNVTSFFNKRGCDVLTEAELFHLVTDATLRCDVTAADGDAAAGGGGVGGAGAGGATDGPTLVQRRLAEVRRAHAGRVRARGGRRRGIDMLALTCLTDVRCCAQLLRRGPSAAAAVD
jgi:hypothetical protein